MEIEDISPLPDLFSSQSIPVEILIYYLHKYKDPGPQDFLINKLYEIPLQRVSNYLPQLVNVSIQRKDPDSFIAYFLDCSQLSHSFALKLYWFLKAHHQDKVPRYSKNLQKMLNSLERAICQGHRSVGKALPQLYPLTIAEPAEETFKTRASYFYEQDKFVSCLIKFSVALIEFPDNQKDEMLVAYLKNLDTYLKHLRFLHYHEGLDSYSSRLHRGIILPFGFMDSTTQQIVKVNYEESKTFKTKARVPYKLIFETVDLTEFN